MSIKCPHCPKTKLKITPKKEQMSYIFECPKCKCKFRLVITYWQPKCYDRFHDMSILRKPKPIKRKKGRPKKK